MSGKVQWCFRMCQRTFKEVSRVFQGREFQGYFKRDFSGYLKELQREFEGSFKGISTVFQEGFKGVPRKFLGCFKKD